MCVEEFEISNGFLGCWCRNVSRQPIHETPRCWNHSIGENLGGEDAYQGSPSSLFCHFHIKDHILVQEFGLDLSKHPILKHYDPESTYNDRDLFHDGYITRIMKYHVWNQRFILNFTRVLYGLHMLLKAKERTNPLTKRPSVNLCSTRRFLLLWAVLLLFQCLLAQRGRSVSISVFIFISLDVPNPIFLLWTYCWLRSLCLDQLGCPWGYRGLFERYLETFQVIRMFIYSKYYFVEFMALSMLSSRIAWKTSCK